jgi:hypothetical protein
MERILAAGIFSPSEIANNLLRQAVAMDDGRPRDDISVLVVSVLPRQEDEVRRLEVRLPL